MKKFIQYSLKNRLVTGFSKECHWAVIITTGTLNWATVKWFTNTCKTQVNITPSIPELRPIKKARIKIIPKRSKMKSKSSALVAQCKKRWLRCSPKWWMWSVIFNFCSICWPSIVSLNVTSLPTMFLAKRSAVPLSSKTSSFLMPDPAKQPARDDHAEISRIQQNNMAALTGSGTKG